jgi:hypothetical protein
MLISSGAAGFASRPATTRGRSTSEPSFRSTAAAIWMWSKVIDAGPTKSSSTMPTPSTPGALRSFANWVGV